MSALLEERVRALRARCRIRAWELRQRAHAKGVWFRLRRVLADAALAFAIPEHEAQRLIAQGVIPEPVGDEIEPRKTILFVPAEAVSGLDSPRDLAVSLSAELLAEPFLVLVPFPETQRARRTPPLPP
jgi:hypothetical protein